MNKSKELCELLGIAPKYATRSLRTGYEQSYSYKTKEEAENMDCEVFELARFPDFQNNAENFVRLLEVMFLFDFNFERKATYKESILCAALNEAKVNNEFKQAAQQVDWSY